MGANWKTTLSAAISAGAAFVLFSSEAHFIVWPNWAMAFAAFAAAGGLLAFGVSAKDKQVTGGTLPNDKPSQ